MTSSLFDPQSIAMLGVSDGGDPPCGRILKNILESRVKRILPVDPVKGMICGFPCHQSIGDIQEPIDLAIISSPLNAVVSDVDACGKKGIKSVLIMSPGSQEKALENELLEVRKRYGLRILGPESFGFIRPHQGLNMTSLAGTPEKGGIALITQGGAFGKSLFDWGLSSHIGFSMFCSLGDCLDLGLGDLIDYLGNDLYTKSIMIYAEDRLGDIKKFMSAARGFSRNKPIVFLKPPLLQEVMEEGQSHTSALVRSEDVFDAVFRRVGIVRVWEANDLFNAAGVLYAKQLPKGARLAVITNAGGAGSMATNRLIRSGGRLAHLSAESLASLDAVIPTGLGRKNPVNLHRDADETRYIEAIQICLRDPGVDGILVIFTLQDGAFSDDLAAAIMPVVREAHKPIITSWMGGKDVHPGRDTLNRNGIPSYDTPEEAARTYLYMYDHQRNLQLSYETPAALPVDEAPSKNHLKAIIRKSCRHGASILTEEDARKFLTNYGIPTIRTETVQHVDEAVACANGIGYPVVLKVVSPDIIFRPDVGGIAANITSDAVLKEEYEKILNHVRSLAPQAQIRGVTIQKMIEVIDYELILGAKKDRTFGSVILFGMGGVGVRIFRDFSVGLPPLNQSLARKLIEDTRVYEMLQGYRGKAPVDFRQLEQIIVSFSNLIVDFPEILEMDINPIAVSNGKSYALGARIIPDKGCQVYKDHYNHLVITPYPTRYIMPWRLKDGTDVLLRPIRPEDEPLEDEMFTGLSEETLRERFYQPIRDITHMMHARSCNIDYDREMTIVAEAKDNGKRRLIGIGSIVVEPDTNKCEFAILVHDSYQGRGLAYKLLDILVGIAQDKELTEFYGFIEQKNLKMNRLCEKLGMTREPAEEGLIKVELFLN